ATGLKTDFSIADPTVWIVVGIGFTTSFTGKVLGFTLPAYVSGQSMAFSLTLGAIMQCKGLMEIVIVTILLQKGVLGPITFTALVLSALLATAIATPLAQLCVRVFGAAATETKERWPAPEVVAEPAARQPQAASGPVLLVEDLPQPIVVPKAEVIIGRHSQDDIRFSDVRMSRHHARLARVDGGYEIHNLTAVRSEPNPMLVNGVEKEHARLSDGDVVSLGGVTFTFKLNNAA
ncbi:MAG: FHA domain-containing protein, partial [Hyphomicrobiaceae bacterium]